MEYVCMTALLPGREEKNLHFEWLCNKKDFDLCA